MKERNCQSALLLWYFKLPYNCPILEPAQNDGMRIRAIGICNVPVWARVHVMRMKSTTHGSCSSSPSFWILQAESCCGFPGAAMHPLLLL